MFALKLNAYIAAHMADISKAFQADCAWACFFSKVQNPILILEAMKNIILLAIGLGLCIQAKGEWLSTTDGITYNNITSQRADPDGLYIEYVLPGGGLGMSKVKFRRLSPDLQKQYGYEADKARDFETKVAKATEDFRQECIRWEQTAQSQRTAQQALDDQRERVMNDRIMAMAQLKQAEAELARAMGSGENYGSGWSSGGGYAVAALPQFGRIPRARTDFEPVVRPVPFPSLNTPDFNRGRIFSRPVTIGKSVTIVK